MHKWILMSVIGLCLLPLGYAKSDPVIIFPRNMSSFSIGGDSNNPFIMDESYNSRYLVKKGDVLGAIIRKHYGGAGLDRSVLQFGIVKSNGHVFRGGNANFMLAGKTMKLPSINELRDMVFSNKSSEADTYQNTGSKNIYFFGQ